MVFKFICMNLSHKYCRLHGKYWLNWWNRRNRLHRINWLYRFHRKYWWHWKYRVNSRYREYW